MSQKLKKIFYAGIIGVSLFEIMNVYFIMPFPGSQEIKSIDFAYFLYTTRWYFRIIFGLMIVAGSTGALKVNRKLIPILSLCAAIAIIYLFNFKMVADSMFMQPQNIRFSTKKDNRVNDSSLVICVNKNGEVKGYPIQFMAYHHQIQDIVGGKPLIITYCSVCRTGRVYLPVVNGRNEKFRLVGMDHFNAMFEDATTGSWWRQATGVAVSGPLKGTSLEENESMQLTINKMFDLYPKALVMQADEASAMKYDTLKKFEKGLSKNKLTMTDTLSWQKKSWVIGIQSGNLSKVYDWNQLKNKHIINDNIGEKPIVLALAGDGQSFVAFERQSETDNFIICNDTLIVNNTAYNLAGKCLTSASPDLKRIDAYQEFWHSWQEFHPKSMRNQ
jgi:hypothetical protein